MEKPPALSQLRTAISQVDKDMLALLAKRRTLALDVARSKAIDIRPIRDTEREKELLARLVSQGREQGLDAHFVLSLYQTIIEDSVLNQQAFLQQQANPDTDKQQYCIAYLGAKGSYSHLAASRYCQRRQFSMVELGCKSFDDIIRSVESGHADFGFLPIENTSSGSINEVYDLLQHTRLAIVGETTIDVGHCLLGKPGTQLSHITKLYAHPQPISQCSRYLSQQPELALAYCASSAAAMEAVMQNERMDIAAIGSAQGGALYGLEVLKDNLANQQINQSRFIVVARKAIHVPEQVPAKTTLIMATGHKPGALVDALLVLKKYQLNMTKLESRPIAGTPWEEMFYLDIDANIDAVNMRDVLSELANLTRFIKVLGCYPCETVAPTQLSQKQLLIEPDTSKTDGQMTTAPVQIQTQHLTLGQDHPVALAELHQLQQHDAQLNWFKTLREQGFQGVIVPAADLSATLAQQLTDSQLAPIAALCSVDSLSQPLPAEILYLTGSAMFDNELLKCAGAQTLPVILERHPDASIAALTQSLDTLRQAGNQSIVLCEAGDETRSGKKVLDIIQLQRLQTTLPCPVIVKAPKDSPLLPKELSANGLIIPCQPQQQHRQQISKLYC